jgi:hypothetical protein
MTDGERGAWQTGPGLAALPPRSITGSVPCLPLTSYSFLLQLSYPPHSACPAVSVTSLEVQSTCSFLRKHQSLWREKCDKIPSGQHLGYPAPGEPWVFSPNSVMLGMLLKCPIYQSEKKNKLKPNNIQDLKHRL